MLWEQLQSFIYVDRSVRGYLKKDKLIDEFNFKNCKCMRFKMNTTSKFLLVLYSKEESLLSMRKNFMPTISSHVHLFIILNIYQTYFNTCQQKCRKCFKNRDFRTVFNRKYNKYNSSLAGMVKQNTVDGRMQKRNFC